MIGRHSGDNRDNYNVQFRFSCCSAWPTRHIQYSDMEFMSLKFNSIGGPNINLD